MFGHLDGFQNSVNTNNGTMQKLTDVRMHIIFGGIFKVNS